VTAPFGGTHHRLASVVSLAVGFALLYLPLAALALASFDASPLSGRGQAFTLVAWRRLATDEELHAALANSLQLALATAVGAVLLGTLAAMALSRSQPWRGRRLFAALAAAPLVVPEVVLALALLLALAAVQKVLGAPDRGLATIAIGHVLLAGAYATVVVRARLIELDPRLDEAALDLGARRAQLFRLVTLPAIAPALLSTALLAFTVSLADVVLAAFLSGPGATTLPMLLLARARLGIDPSLAAAATLAAATVALLVLPAAWLVARAMHRRDPPPPEALP